MADYNDYLEYLHHVDDTTAQEFKKKEDELRHQIDVVRNQCEREIRNIRERAAAEKAQSETDHKSAIDSLTSQYEASVEKLKTEKKQIEAAHKAELKRVNAEKENAISQLTDEKNAALAKVEEEKESAVNQLNNEHTAAMDAALSAAEKKRKSEVKELMNKVSQYESLLQQKENAFSELIEKHNQELTELNLKQEKQIEAINEQNEDKLSSLALQLQGKEEKLKDVEQIWQNKLLSIKREYEQRLKEKEIVINNNSEIVAHERKSHEQQVSRLNREVQILKNGNDTLRSDRYTIYTQLNDSKRINESMERQISEMTERMKEFEKGMPMMDSKNGLLAFLIIAFILVLIIIFKFTAP